MTVAERADDDEPAAAAGRTQGGGRCAAWQRDALAMAGLVLAMSAVTIAFGERIGVNRGQGWDGMAYTEWAQDFWHKVVGADVTRYHAQRILPSAVIHYGLRLVGLPTDAPHVIWLRIGYDVHDHWLRFPNQRYFMNHGPYANDEMYLVHAIAAAVTLVALGFALGFAFRHEARRGAERAAANHPAPRSRARPRGNVGQRAGASSARSRVARRERDRVGAPSAASSSQT